MLGSNLAVFNLAAGRDVHFELKIAAEEGTSVCDRCFPRGHCEWVTLVANDDQVGEGVELEGVVKFPVDGAGVEGEGAEVGLGEESLCEVGRELGLLAGEPHAVSAHLPQNVVSEDHYLSRAELDPDRVGTESGRGHPRGEVRGQTEGIGGRGRRFPGPGS